MKIQISLSARGPGSRNNTPRNYPKVITLKSDWVNRIWTSVGNPWAPSTPALEKKLNASDKAIPAKHSAKKGLVLTARSAGGDGLIEYKARQVEMYFTLADLRKYSASGDLSF